MTAEDREEEPLVGLSEPSRSATAADFFERFAWDGSLLDPKIMPAFEFLDVVLGGDAHRR